ncbi:MAG: VOC family protein [Ktedonobacteraceae bacterium]
MALELYMLGLVVQDMSKSLEFYRRLGLAIPEGSEEQTHVEVKMGSGLTFFLDSRPSRWDPRFVRKANSGQREAPDDYSSILEFYLKTQEAVDAKYAELTGFGYQGYRAPYETSFGMCFAMINDPDGNIILLSGDLKANKTS